LDQSREKKGKIIAQSQGEEEYPRYNKTKKY